MDELIYDRTEQDVEYAKTHQSSEDFLKGAYNYTDLNRIESWCEYLKTELNKAGYTTNITTKTDWNMAGFPMQSQLERIRSNISTLKNAFYSYTNVPTNLNNMTYKKANDIEKILEEMHNMMWRNDRLVCIFRSGQRRTKQTMAT